MAGVTGVKCDPKLISAYQAYSKSGDESKITHDYIVAKIEKGWILIDEAPAKGECEATEEEKKKADASNIPVSYLVLRRKLIEAKNRYAFYTFRGANKKASMTLINYNDDSSKIKEKMLYAGSKEYIKNSCGGFNAYVEANDADELDFKEMIKANKLTV